MLYMVRRDSSNQYYWIFSASNHEEIARSSESYRAKADCLRGIELVKGSATAPIREE